LKNLSNFFGKHENKYKKEIAQLNKEIKLLNEESLKRDFERDNQERKIQLLEEQLEHYEDYEIRAEWEATYTRYYYYIKTYKNLSDTLKLLNRANLYINLLENTLDEDKIKAARNTFDKLLEVKCNENRNSA